MPLRFPRCTPETGLITHLIEDHGLKPWSVLGAMADQHDTLHSYTGTLPTHEHAKEDVLECSLCGHEPHDGEFCGRTSGCADHAEGHRCACSFPDPENYAELP